MSKLTLRLFFDERLVGVLEVSQEEGEPRFRFTYSEAWLTHPKAFALSVVLPLQASPYQHKEARAYVENLLPEGEVMTQLRRYARQRGELTGQLVFHKCLAPISRERARGVS